MTKDHIATRRRAGSFVVEKQGQNVRLRDAWGGEDWGCQASLPAMEELVEGQEAARAWKRGKIDHFSAGSRRRFMRSMQALDLVRMMSKYHLVFGGLTYPEEYPTAKASKGHWEALRERLRRKYGGQVFGWSKLEPQKRGAPHFHFLLLLPKDITRDGESWYKEKGGRVVVDCPAEVGEFHDWLRGAWFEIVDSGDLHHMKHGVYVDVVEKPERVAAYVAKYLGKPQDVDGLTWREPGRFWGIVGREVLKGYLTGEIFVVSREVYVKVRRILRRFGISKAKAAGRRRAADGKSGNWRRPAGWWLGHARRLQTWNTWDPGGGRGVPGMVASLLAAYGYLGVVKVRGVFMK